LHRFDVEALRGRDLLGVLLRTMHTKENSSELALVAQAALADTATASWCTKQSPAARTVPSRASHTPRTSASFLSAVVLPELSRPSIRMRSSWSSFLRLRSNESRPLSEQARTAGSETEGWRTYLAQAARARMLPSAVGARARSAKTLSHGSCEPLASVVQSYDNAITAPNSHLADLDTSGHARS
jgi:hypothetical protein